jgi:hypothetical protein
LRARGLLTHAVIVRRACGQEAGEAEAFGDEVENAVVDRGAGHIGEQTAVIPALLVNSDQIELVAIEDERVEVSARELRGPGWEAPRGFGARQGGFGTDSDRSPVYERLMLARKPEARYVECVTALGFGGRLEGELCEAGDLALEGLGDEFGTMLVLSAHLA